jgi:phosphate starvation-inducible PhoH-like protein
VVRHALVQRIVRAYESAKPQQELPLALGEGIQVGPRECEERPQTQAIHVAKPQ